MSLYVYKSKEFEDTYENLLFEELYNELGPLYESRPDNVFLIGNFSCQEKLIDAVLIKKNAIIILEFKNHGGAISFENNNLETGVWRTDGKEIKCGQAYMNPYRQVASYKTALGDTLKQTYSVDSVNTYQSHGIVLFNRNVEKIETFSDYRFYIWDANDVSWNTWFHIVDKTKVGNKIIHISSRDVWYNDSNLTDLIARLKDQSLMYHVTEFKRSDSTVFDFFKTKNFKKESWLVSEVSTSMSLDDFIRDMEKYTVTLLAEYAESTKENLSKIFQSVDAFTIADESAIKNFTEEIYYSERAHFYSFASQLNDCMEKEIQAKNLQSEKVQKTKADFILAFNKKMITELKNMEIKQLREIVTTKEEELKNILHSIGEKVFGIKSYFFAGLTSENELEVEFNQKNNLLLLEIGLRSYLFLKYKESLNQIRELLRSPVFSAISFIPLILKIPKDSPDFISMQDYLIFALIMQKNLERAPFKEPVDYIVRELKINADEASESINKMQTLNYIFNLDKNGSSRLYINAPKILKLKEELMSDIS
ncbi:MAG: nuclease-like protein [Ignavibacteria bacterium]|nr:nuclease-like protein [Ignavibacteria bacterium]